MLKRYLEISDVDKIMIDELSFSGLIRKGNEKGLLLSAGLNGNYIERLEMQLVMLIMKIKQIMYFK